MEGFNNILLAYDGSESSISALKTAENLSKVSGAHLTVAFVHDPSTETSVKPRAVASNENPGLYYTSTYVGVVPKPGDGVYHEEENIHLQEDKPEKKIADAKSRLSNIVKADYEVLVGKPADRIIGYVNQHDIDLIIMGNRGLSGLKKLVTGSVSKKVIDEADCPVLVVK
ncbi:universal stress protein [Paucisalibacillus sp. EB02]|uniref:universal stress protein n=1 Tax=Paucisalibacillus sp. EB02 TaxID=1347087 RepID=UPI0004BB6350|nr:universal stress protein [Paucisalibacillus sp. EB02]